MSTSSECRYGRAGSWKRPTSPPARISRRMASASPVLPSRRFRRWIAHNSSSSVRLLQLVLSVGCRSGLVLLNALPKPQPDHVFLFIGKALPLAITAQQLVQPIPTRRADTDVVQSSEWRSLAPRLECPRQERLDLLIGKGRHRSARHKGRGFA
jgi:hypothetical protein